jgi:hypothetical protein
MDPVTIATAAIAILTPYVKDAGQELVKTVGEIAVQKTKRLLGWLKEQFTGDPVASKDLERFKKDPAAFEPGLKAAITEKAQADPVFAGELKKQVDEIGPLLNIRVTIDDGEDVLGLKAGKVHGGKINVDIDMHKGKNVKGADVTDFG